MFTVIGAIQPTKRREDQQERERSDGRREGGREEGGREEERREREGGGRRPGESEAGERKEDGNTKRKGRRRMGRRSDTVIQRDLLIDHGSEGIDDGGGRDAHWGIEIAETLSRRSRKVEMRITLERINRNRQRYLEAIVHIVRSAK